MENGIALNPRNAEVTVARGQRELSDLISIGPAMLRDFELLGIRSVAQLAEQDPRALYGKLARVAPRHLDICVLDTFAAAVAQAKNPRLPAEQCQWWWWSRKRKSATEAQGHRGAGWGRKGKIA